ncbi:unnamed protein product [Adineta ricciae]|uniref:Uncharacterized protein n=1 Tax=Adineta ricciae TaxID=249248 RepID=A0A813MDJ8_ADIRI|nr:unnamed protein product [Adineta ricciae]
MVEPSTASSGLWRAVLPICIICVLYLSSFFLFVCATNSLIYSTVCLLRANASFCAQIDQNQSFHALQESIQKESSQWTLYGTLSFSIIACILSPIYGSLSDTKNRKLPIVLTIFANIVNGFGGGALILISSCFGYATDPCTDKDQQVQTIALIEASLNIGVVIGYLLCTFIFEVHARIWHILLTHVLLLVLTLIVSLVFLRTRSVAQASRINLRQKLMRPLVDTHDLFVGLRQNSLLVSFLILLIALFFYDLFRMGSSSIIYLYLHQMSFDDAHYAAYFTFEQLATCLALIILAVMRRRWNVNDLYLACVGLCLSLVGPFLFAFARNNRAMIFGAIPSSMFCIYFSVCLRSVIARLVPEQDKGKAFGFVALIQNLDVVVGTITCVEIYQASIDFFPGLVFVFAAITRILALILILTQAICITRTPQLAIATPVDESEQPILDTEPNETDEQLVHA